MLNHTATAHEVNNIIAFLTIKPTPQSDLDVIKIIPKVRITPPPPPSTPSIHVPFPLATLIFVFLLES